MSEMTRQEMTQKKLAELSGVSRASVNYIKSGKNCSDEVGLKIVNVLKVPFENLVRKTKALGGDWSEDEQIITRQILTAKNISEICGISENKAH